MQQASQGGTTIQDNAIVLFQIGKLNAEEIIQNPTNVRKKVVRAAEEYLKNPNYTITTS
jgi:hypothetical protein